MFPTHRQPHPRLTGRIMLYALADIFGLTCVALGGAWFAIGKGAILASFPGSTAEAVAAIVGGAAVMVWAVARILRELALQGPEMQTKYDAYLAARHPDKVRPTDDGR